MLDSQEAHASDLADIEHVAERYKLPVYEGKIGDIFTHAGHDQEGRPAAPSRPRSADGLVSAPMETRLLIRGEQVAGEGRALGRREPGHRGDAGGARRRRRRSSSTPRSPARARRRPAGARPRRSSARSCCTRSPARMRALTDDLARAMTLEGGKPLVENSDEVGWTAAAFDYYAEMGRNFAGRVIPSIEATQLALVVKEPTRRVGRDRALELPAAAAVLEARAGARRRQHGRRQAVGADAGLDPDARRVLRGPAGRGRQPGRGRRRRGRGAGRGPAHRRRGVHRLGGHRQEGRGGLRRSAWRA